MAEADVTSLSQRIALLEDALAEYAQFYGVTPKARAVFAGRDLSGMPWEPGARATSPAAPHFSEKRADPSSV